MSNKVMKIFGVGLAVMLAGLWAAAALRGEMNPDSGYYLALARHVAGGLSPNVDFPSPYVPGVFYIFALLGENGVSSPTACKALVFLVHGINAALLFALLRMLGHSTALGFFLSVVFGAWVMACDGTAISLEPFQNLFLLLGLAIMLRWPSVRGAALGGVAVGAALMAKQYSLLSVPVLSLVALCPVWLSSRGDQDSEKPCRISWGRIAAFLACLGLPFLVYALGTGQNLIEAFKLAATFGGGAGDYASTGGYKDHKILQTLTRDALGARMVLPLLVVSLWLLVLERTRTNFLLIAGFILNLLPLIIRGWPHYIQLAAPWGVLIIAQFARAVGSRCQASVTGQNLVAGLLALPLIPAMMLCVQSVHRAWEIGLIDHQSRLAGEVVEALPAKENILVLNGTWLYYLAKLTPPYLDYRFVQGAQGNDDMRSGASHVVVMPKEKFPKEEAKKWLAEGGFEAYKTLKWLGKPVVLYRKVTPGEQSPPPLGSFR